MEPTALAREAARLIRSAGHPGRRALRHWDFLFYASFGVVVTSSVAIAGVLLVFCYPIVPSVAAMLYADTVGKRLASVRPLFRRLPA